MDKTEGDNEDVKRELRRDADRLGLGPTDDTVGKRGNGNDMDGTVELAVGLRSDGAIIVNFGVPMAALVLNKKQAKALRASLLEAILGAPPRPRSPR
jgi:hypothetical protein